MKHEGERNKVRLEAPVVIIQMKNTIYITIQTDWTLLEGLLFWGPLVANISERIFLARHARASPTLTHQSCGATSNISGCF